VPGPRLSVRAPSGALAPSDDPGLEAALKEVLLVIYKSHPLKANQILVLSSELQRIGVHKLVEEHLERFQKRE
jgi:hypothetical protein